MNAWINAWVRELDAEVIVCDAAGILVEMNNAAKASFERGGRDVQIGANVFDYHPEAARARLVELMEKQLPNPYYATKGGKTTFVFQSPWYQDGQFAGFVQVSFPVPDEIPHYVRG